MPPIARRLTIYYSTLAILLLICAVLIVPIGNTPQRGTATIIVTNYTGDFSNNFSASAISTSFSTNYIGGMDEFSLTPEMNMAEPAIIYTQTKISMTPQSGYALLVDFYSNSSFSHPTYENFGTSLTFSYVSNVTAPFEEFNASAYKGLLTDPGQVGAPLVGHIGKNLSLVDWTTTSQGSFVTSHFSASLTSGFSVFHFNLSAGKRSFNLDGNTLNVTAPYVIISYFGTLSLYTEAPAISKISTAALTNLQLSSEYPPFASFSIDSKNSTIFENNGNQKSVDGIISVSPYGSLNISFKQPFSDYETVTAANSFIDINGNNLFHSPHYLIDNLALRILFGIILGAVGGSVIGQLLIWGKEKLKK